MEVTELNYAEENARQFCRDMEKAGLEVRHYQGRNFFEGPAVVVDDIQDCLSNTKVKCQWDSMGRSSSICYPRKSAKLIGNSTLPE